MIPPQLTGNFLPMLAVQSNKTAANVFDAVTSLHNTGKYIFDVKWDGIRAFAYLDGGVVTLINRRLVDITYRYPDVVDSLRITYGNETRLLDGEIIVIGANGHPDFASIHRRDAQANGRSASMLLKSMPATFMAFDLLCYGGDDIRMMPYMARRALLAGESQRFTQVRGVDWSESSEDGLSMWQFVMTHGLEGLIAKTKSGPYRSGRQQSWIKLKQTFRITVIAGGYKPGKGRRSLGVGAVTMWLLDGNNDPVDIGEVGTGFNDADLAEMKLLLDAGKTVLMEVELQNITKDGKARFPSFKGIRDDVSVLDANMTQLTGIPVI